MKSFNHYALFSFFGVLFLLILYKVLEVPITHDEVPATIFYSKFSFWEIMMFPDNIPNNHILNTLITKLSIIIFGKEQWAIRLPNLLSFIIFTIGVFRLIKIIFKNDSYYFLPAAIIFINPYLLDFFGLCRGYGMSSAFLTLSVSYLVSGYLKSKDKHIWIALIFSIIASYANFTLLVFWMAISILVWFYFLKKVDQKISTLVKPTIIIGLVTLGYLSLIAIPIIKMQSTNEFQYWTSQGFYKETILSLIHNWRYDSKILFKIKSHFITIPVFTVLFSGCVASFIQLKKTGFKLFYLKNPVFTSTSLLLLTALISIAQSVILKTPNLNGRTALFFYPLFSAVLISVLGLISDSRKPFQTKYFPIILFFIGLMNLTNRLSTKSVKEWSYDQNNIEVINYLKDKFNGHPINLNTSWFFNPSFTFYAETGKTPWIKLYPYDKNIDLNTSAEYYYVFSEDYKNLKPRFEIVYQFSPNRWLLKKKSHERINDIE